MIHYLCAKCGKVVKVIDALAGKPIACSKCGTMRRVPARDTSAEPAVSDEEALEE